MIEAINPATGRSEKRYPATDRPALERALNRARSAFLEWSQMSFAARGAVLHRAGEVLARRRDEFARLMTSEMGKPIAQAGSEIDKCASACHFFADRAESFLADQVASEASARRAYMCFRPLGVVLAIMPWNFPFWQAFRFAAPGLMAGNAAVLKHASNVPGCALAIARVFAEAQAPEGLFETVLIESRDIPQVIEDPRIAAVTLTGSVEAGRSVARAAGAALKKTVLELGGSDGYVVLDDADLESAVQVCVRGRLVNSGQSCIAAKRFIVTEKNRRPFEDRMVHALSAVRMGDPLDENTEVGPLARQDLRAGLHHQVLESVARGARLLLGGAIPAGPGAFYPPTVLTEVRPGMPAYEEELFGPVAAILPARDEADAIRIANDTAFGLGACVLGGDLERAERIAADQLEAGNCFVNEPVRSDLALAFGGIKASGYGRELSSFGIREFVNVKSVLVA